MNRKRIVIIGAGPGGYVAAVKAAHLGASVTLIEKKTIGGTCLNVGCIPTKALLHSAELLTVVKSEAKRLGVLVDNPRLDWGTVQKRKATTVSRLVTGTLDLVRNNGVEYVEGEAVLQSASSVAVGDRVFEADAVIIATGSEPEMPDTPGFGLEGVITSDEALSLQALPSSVAISGGGVIGMEFAAAFAAFGARVSVIVTSPRILRSVDAEAAMVLRKTLEKKGVAFYTGASVTGVTETDTGLSVKMETESGAKEIEAEKLLVAKGRNPYLKGLGVEALGLETRRGRIVTDAQMRTNVPGVYAIGDCVNPYMLAHVASREGEVAVGHIMGHDVAMDYSTTPACIYTRPEIACVGMSEEDAEKKGIKVRVGRFPLMTNGKSMITGDNSGLAKVIADEETKKILGVVIVGGPATDMIAEAALAIHLGATPEDLVETIHAHPTVSESVAEAAANVFGQAVHTPSRKG